ncbi:hypothetical protein D7Z26_06610 [Cohnella endophytica]|uniref:Uncharacterized protein n=1 Tax=Cohnella endophytica TaxID=2419778 RepID=A0A494Y0K5_9BACL|nr:hypothetical protein D7Z26_06610 [Cohnella endophytica]
MYLRVQGKQILLMGGANNCASFFYNELGFKPLTNMPTHLSLEMLPENYPGNRGLVYVRFLADRNVTWDAREYRNARENEISSLLSVIYIEKPAYRGLFYLLIIFC